MNNQSINDETKMLSNMSIMHLKELSIKFQSLKDHKNPPMEGGTSCIVLSKTFDLRLRLLSLVPTFHGMESENPYTHLSLKSLLCMLELGVLVTCHFGLEFFVL